MKKIETKTYDWVDAEMRVATYGIFTHDADSCDKEMFFKTYGRNMNGVDNYSMAGDKLFKKLKKTLKYFELISSSNYWKYMPGSGPRLVNI